MMEKSHNHNGTVMKLFYATILAISLSACGGKSDSVTLELAGPDQPPTEDVQTAVVTPEGVDHSATNVAELGRSDAREMLASCADENQIRSALLNINAKRYRTATMASEEVADEYMRGFLDELQTRGDTLYHTLSPIDPLPN